ncbi:IclR family transcriptional regulator domain-containing protein [Actinomadura rubrisoli]
MREAHPVGPLQRGLQVMEVFGVAGGPLRPADLVTATGLARSTVDRVVGTLAETGYLRRQGRDVAATPRMMRIGNLYLSGLDPDGSLARRIAELATALDESVSLAVPDADGVRIVGQSRHSRSVAVAFKVGDLLPAERCAPGPIFAAEWDEERWRAWEGRVTGGTDRPFSIVPATEPAAVPVLRGRVEDFRASGWSIDDQLIEPDLVAVAVPVRDAAGAAVLALSVVSHTSRHTPGSLRAYARPLVTACAAEMEKALTHRRPGGTPAPRTGAGGELKARLGAEFLQSLDRGLAVLHAIGTRPDGLTISEAAAATGQPRATARRALLTLAGLGYARETGRRYRLPPRVLDLGYREVSRLTFEELARPHLRALVAKVRDSASVAVLDAADIRYVARAQASRLMRVEISVGTRLPAHVTAMGRVLLAGLPDTEAAALIARADRQPLTPRTLTGETDLRQAVTAARADGHALVDQELETGLRSIAAPIHAAGRVVASLNIAAPAGREPAERTRERLLPDLLATARALETDVATFATHQPLPF